MAPRFFKYLQFEFEIPYEFIKVTSLQNSLLKLHKYVILNPYFPKHKFMTVLEKICVILYLFFSGELKK